MARVCPGSAPMWVSWMEKSPLLAAFATVRKRRSTPKVTSLLPGFIDGHTHMDAQVSWDPLGTCSCWHGITSVVMGNCGFSLAPCKESEKDMVMRNLERAEDIAPEAMNAGIKWTWETFPEYLDSVERLPKGINYAAYMGTLRPAHPCDGRARPLPTRPLSRTWSR